MAPLEAPLRRGFLLPANGLRAPLVRISAGLVGRGPARACPSRWAAFSPQNWSLYDRAIEDYDAAIKIKPDYALAFDSRALAYWLLGDQDKARQDLDRARQIDPSFPSWQDRFHEFEGML